MSFNLENLVNDLKAQKLKPGSKPWRKVDYTEGYHHGNTANYKEALAALLPFVQVVLRDCEEYNRELPQFVLAEAKAMKMTVPPIPALPPKPFARKPKKQLPEQKGVCHAVSKDGTPAPEIIEDVQPLCKVELPATEITAVTTTAAVTA